MNTFEVMGVAGLTLKYSGDLLDTAQSLPTAVLHPPTTKYMRFTAGVATLVAGVTLTGQTSGAVLTVSAVVVTSGTLAGNDGAGIIFVTVVSGVAQTDENLRISTTTQCVSRTAVLTMPQPMWNAGSARGLLLQVETGAIRFTLDGSTPTTTSETGDTNFGAILNPLDSYPIKGDQNISNLKFINAATATNGVVNIFVFYGGGE